MGTETISEIDAQLSELKNLESVRQAELDTARQRIRDIESEYDAKSVQAINYGDSAAKEWLSNSDRLKYDAESLVTQITAALKEIRSRIANLNEQRALAVRRDIETQLEAEALAAISDALSLDEAIAKMIATRDAVYSRRDKMAALARQLGQDPRRYEKIGVHMRRSVVQQCFPEGNVWMEQRVRELYRQPFSKLLEPILLGVQVLVDDGEENRKAS